MLRSILFQERLCSGEFDEQLLAYDVIENFKGSPKVQAEITLQKKILELQSFVKGKMTRNELQMPAIWKFLHK